MAVPNFSISSLGGICIQMICFGSSKRWLLRLMPSDECSPSRTSFSRSALRSKFQNVQGSSCIEVAGQVLDVFDVFVDVIFLMFDWCLMLLSQPIWDLMIFSVRSIGSHGVFFSVFLRGCIKQECDGALLPGIKAKWRLILSCVYMNLAFAEDAPFHLEISRHNLDVMMLDSWKMLRVFVCTSSIHRRFHQPRTPVKFAGIAWLGESMCWRNRMLCGLVVSDPRTCDSLVFSTAAVETFGHAQKTKQKCPKHRAARLRKGDSCSEAEPTKVMVNPFRTNECWTNVISSEESKGAWKCCDFLHGLSTMSTTWRCVRVHPVWECTRCVFDSQDHSRLEPGTWFFTCRAKDLNATNGVGEPLYFDWSDLWICRWKTNWLHQDQELIIFGMGVAISFCCISPSLRNTSEACACDGEIQQKEKDQADAVALVLAGVTWWYHVCIGTTPLAWQDAKGMVRHGMVFHSVNSETKPCRTMPWARFRLDSPLGTLASNECSAELTSEFHR